MLHNSIHRRELLREMNANPHVVHRRDVHRNVGVLPDFMVKPGQLDLRSGVRVQTARNLDAENLVAEDARDFFSRLGVKTSDDANIPLLLEIGSCAHGFRTVVDSHRVELHAADASSLWAAWVSLENEMRIAGGPAIHVGERSARPAWATQIAPPTWGANYAVPDFSAEYLSDETFRSLAHAGANGMFIYGEFLVYAYDTHLTQLNQPDALEHLDLLKDAAKRAAPYGIKFYYVLVSPKLPADHPVFKAWPNTRGALLHHDPHSKSPPIHCLCSSDEDALKFHAEAVGGIFKHVPEMGGAICIIGGESYYHCFMRASGAPIGSTNCPRCNGKMPEDVIANFLDVTAKGIKQYAPAAKIMAWPYSAQFFWSRERSQLALIDRLPESVGLLSEIDKDQVLHKVGYDKTCWDYSVDFEGASDRIIAQATCCKLDSRELFIKTETSHGIEVLNLPYAPGISRSARKWQSVRSVRPDGVLQRWGFVGMYDSAAERVGYLARWDPNFEPERAAMDVARQLCGPAAPQVAQAWKYFDEALAHLPNLTTGGYYHGPLFLGPGHPLPCYNGPTPAAFLGNLFYLAESEPTGSTARYSVKDDFTIHSAAQLGAPPLPIQQREYETGRDLCAKAYDILRSIDTGKMNDATKAEVLEQLAVGEYQYRTFRTCANFLAFFIAKTADQKRSIAKDELENTMAAEKMWQQFPWLNHKLRLDVGAPDSLAMTAEKIKLLKAFIV